MASNLLKTLLAHHRPQTREQTPRRPDQRISRHPSTPKAPTATQPPSTAPTASLSIATSHPPATPTLPSATVVTPMMKWAMPSAPIHAPLLKLVASRAAPPASFARPYASRTNPRSSRRVPPSPRSTLTRPHRLPSPFLLRQQTRPAVQMPRMSQGKRHPTSRSAAAGARSITSLLRTSTLRLMCLTPHSISRLVSIPNTNIVPSHSCPPSPNAICSHRQKLSVSPTITRQGAYLHDRKAAPR